MGVIGLERPSKNISNSQISGKGNAESDALFDDHDSDLAEIVNAWPSLDDGIRAAIVAIARANVVRVS